MELNWIRYNASNKIYLNKFSKFLKHLEFCERISAKDAVYQKHYQQHILAFLTKPTDKIEKDNAQTLTETLAYLF